MARHRVRYVGGINSETARALKWETGADAVLITSVELYSEIFPPKIALTARLVSTGNSPKILWIDGIGLAGDDSVGLLELSLIRDSQPLLHKAVGHLATSLGDYLSGEEEKIGRSEGSIRFWPKTFYRSPVLHPEVKYRVAVAPFFNLSQRGLAGEMMALHFAQQLKAFGNFALIEPGVVRDAFLRTRTIMLDGLSLADADALFSKLDVDLILTGKIFDYQDYEGGSGKAKVDFSALLLDRQSGEEVWACESQNEGDEGVFFFGWGTIHTAHMLASEMVLSALDTMTE